jgi:hypothetical protein
MLMHYKQLVEKGIVQPIWGVEWIWPHSFEKFSASDFSVVLNMHNRLLLSSLVWGTCSSSLCPWLGSWKQTVWD